MNLDSPEPVSNIISEREAKIRIWMGQNSSKNRSKLKNKEKLTRLGHLASDSET